MDRQYLTEKSFMKNPKQIFMFIKLVCARLGKAIKADLGNNPILFSTHYRMFMFPE